jgi:hypothetical protein
MKRAFISALREFVEDADSGQFRPSLRVKRVRSARGRLWEMSFARDGRAIFEMGAGRYAPGPHAYPLAPDRRPRDPRRVAPPT